MVRTRVGYAGGSTPSPTYHAIGDHTESLEIDFDPAAISYEQLAELFWASHDPAGRAWSRQYQNILFYRDQAQRAVAEASLARRQGRGGPVRTEVLPLTAFHLAEDYHQKYRLRQVRELIREFRRMYPDWRDLTASTAAARVNGFLGGYGDAAALERLAPDLGLGPQALVVLRDVVGGRLG